MFLKGFSEAIAIAVVLVITYLVLNVITVIASFMQVFQHPLVFTNWSNAVSAAYTNPLLLVGVSLFFFFASRPGTVRL